MIRSERPKITISDPIHEAINRVNKAIWAIVSILVLGFVTMLLMVAGLVLDAWRSKNNSYEGLIETIRAQEKLIDANQKERIDFKQLIESLQRDIMINKK